MAWKLKYRCSQCGYEAEVYEGRGLFRQEIRAVSCPDCKSIQNIVVGGIIAQEHPEHCGGRYHCRRGTLVQKRGRQALFAMWQRAYPTMGWAYLSQVPGPDGADWRKGVLDLTKVNP